jgi:signal peptidase I
MPAAVAGVPPPTEPVRAPRGSVRWAVLAVALIFLGAFALAQLQVLLSRGVAPNASLMVYLGSQAALLGLVVVAARLGRRPLRDYGFVVRGPIAATLLFSVLLVLAYLAAEIYPGFLFGFGRLPLLSVLPFGFALLSAPVIALGQESLFRGYIFRTLSHAVPLSSAMAISAALFAAQLTNFVSVLSLGELSGGEYLFGTTVANFVLGLVLALQFYKSRWSLLGPVATRTGILWVVTLLPVAANFSGWETAFAVLLLGYGVMFALVAVGLREPKLQAHRYLGETIGPRRLRFRLRARSRRELRGAVTMVGVMAVVLVGATQVTPAVLGASPPLLAVASGSMVPTFDRGTLVVLEHAAPTMIHVGTILAFRVSCLPAPTVHRVYRILQGGSSPVYQTKGDANPSPDPCSVPYSAVIGRVVAFVPFLGLLVLDPLLAGAAVLLILLATLMVPRRDRWRSP